MILEFVGKNLIYQVSEKDDSIMIYILEFIYEYVLQFISEFVYEYVLVYILGFACNLYVAYTFYIVLLFILADCARYYRHPWGTATFQLRFDLVLGCLRGG